MVMVLLLSVVVNLMALVVRLIRTCSTLDGSKRTQLMPSSLNERSTTNLICMSAVCNSPSNIFSARCTTVIGCTSTGVTISSAESSFERVKTSSMMRFWCCAHNAMVCAESMLSSNTVVDAPRGCCARARLRDEMISSEHCSMADSGFLISWLVMSIKFSCCRLSSTASSILRFCRPSTHFCWLILVMLPKTLLKAPCPPVSG